MSIQILSPDCKCPICERELAVELFTRIDSRKSYCCPNECFVYYDHITEASINLFYDDFYVISDKLSHIVVYDKIEDVQKKIEYWKENYRYVAEILERK